MGLSRTISEIMSDIYHIMTDRRIDGEQKSYQYRVRIRTRDNWCGATEAASS